MTFEKEFQQVLEASAKLCRVSMSIVMAVEDTSLDSSSKIEP